MGRKQAIFAEPGPEMERAANGRPLLQFCTGLQAVYLPLSVNIRSGPNPRQDCRVAHVGQTAKPPPGFCQAAGLPCCTEVTSQPHSPLVSKMTSPWTDTQYVPALSLVVGILMVNEPVPLPLAWILSYSATF